jgi:hypothetical protein
MTFEHHFPVWYGPLILPMIYDGWLGCVITNRPRIHKGVRHLSFDHKKWDVESRGSDHLAWALDASPFPHPWRAFAFPSVFASVVILVSVLVDWGKTVLVLAVFTETTLSPTKKAIAKQMKTCLVQTRKIRSGVVCHLEWEAVACADAFGPLVTTWIKFHSRSARQLRLWKVLTGHGKLPLDAMYTYIPSPFQLVWREGGKLSRECERGETRMRKTW